jgi:hypothetical protein
MPATTPWYQGTVVPLTWTSTDGYGNAFAGTTIVCTVTAPDGTISTVMATGTGTFTTGALSVTSNGTGACTASYTTSQAGHHLVTWTAVATGQADAFADTFEVQSAQDPTIVSLAEAREILHLQSSDGFDAVIQGYNASVTEWIEYVCGPVVQQTVTETLPARGTETILSKPPVLDLLPWTVLPAELAGLGITLPSPESPMIRTRVYGIEWPLTQLYCDLRRGIVTHTAGLPFYYCAYIWQYQAGRLVIPAGIYQASKITLEHLFQVERGGAGSADVSAGESDTTMTGFGFAVPNRALQLLLPYSSPSRMVAA